MVLFDQATYDKRITAQVRAAASRRRRSNLTPVPFPVRFSSGCWVSHGMESIVSAEVEQKEARGEGEQRGAVRPGHLRQAAVRGAQVQADHTFRPLFEASGNLHLPFFCSICLDIENSVLVV